MRSSSIQQTLVEDIKKEVLMDLNRLHGRSFRDQRLVDNIKQEVLMELDQHYHREPPYPNRSFIDSIKNEVLADIRSGMQPGSMYIGNHAPADRVLIESVKGEVIAQIEAEQEASEESRTREQDKTAPKERITPDPALVQAVKSSIMAEINAPYYK